MMNQKIPGFWKYIDTYQELIKIGKTHMGLDFELYQSREEQLGWSRLEPENYQPDINPLKGVYANSVKNIDISQMVLEMINYELKRDVGFNSLDILLKNEDSILKILNDIQAYNILENSGVK